uniref:Partial AB-hydrolase lipase domain-containing protein n=2 Tax=Lutzomyia longipalpis TaxID=7200 RepID=A0A1B0CF41_LUTLO
MIKFSILTFLILGVTYGFSRDFSSKDGFNPLNVVDMIVTKGYPVESYEVQTEDGYLLTMHRIPYGKTNESGPAPNKPVVFLQHGLLSSSTDWVVIGPDNGALGYLLADAGYDVWMGNARGNVWSRKHVSLNPDNPLTRHQFWDFSWHEMAIYDIPAMIDFILKTTGRTKLHYVGHSQGTTVLFVMLSLKPQYNDKLLSAQALAPIAFMSHLKSPFIRAIAPFNSFDLFTKLIGADEFAPTNEAFELGGYLACQDASPIQDLCSNIIFIICGFNSQQLNETIIPTFLENSPAGASTKQFAHYGQVYNSGKFCQYDYGPVTNMIKYKSATPPDYPLDQITAPIALYYSDNDWLNAVVDVMILVSKLSNNDNFIGAFRVADPNFNHMDYLLAIDTIIPTFLANAPAGASTKQFAHYGQLVNSGNFCQYDYGSVTNMIKYKSATPPAYPLDQITAPIALYYSDNDWLSAVVDVMNLVSKLSNNDNFIGAFHVADPNFNHLDYLLAIDVKFLVYDDVINIIKIHDE